MALNNFDLMSLADKQAEKSEMFRQRRLNGAFDISSSALSLAGGIVGLIYPAVGNIIAGASQATSLGGTLARTVDNASRIHRTSHLPSLKGRLNGLQD